MQNIPSHNKDLRMQFCSPTIYHEVDSQPDNDNIFIVPDTDDVQTDVDWKRVKDLQVGDNINLGDCYQVVKAITKIDTNYQIEV